MMAMIKWMGHLVQQTISKTISNRMNHIESCLSMQHFLFESLLSNYKNLYWIQDCNASSTALNLITFHNHDHSREIQYFYWERILLQAFHQYQHQLLAIPKHSQTELLGWVKLRQGKIQIISLRWVDWDSVCVSIKKINWCHGRHSCPFYILQSPDIQWYKF